MEDDTRQGIHGAGTKREAGCGWCRRHLRTHSPFTRIEYCKTPRYTTPRCEHSSNAVRLTSDELEHLIHHFPELWAVLIDATSGSLFAHESCANQNCAYTWRSSGKSLFTFVLRHSSSIPYNWLKLVMVVAWGGFFNSVPKPANIRISIIWTLGPWCKNSSRTLYHVLGTGHRLYRLAVCTHRCIIPLLSHQDSISKILLEWIIKSCSGARRKILTWQNFAWLFTKYIQIKYEKCSLRQKSITS